jgi:hypothetical protein
MFIYGGITVGSLIGAYVPVMLFHVSALGMVSIVGGLIGSFVGLYFGYKADQNFGD